MMGIGGPGGTRQGSTVTGVGAIVQPSVCMYISYLEVHEALELHITAYPTHLHMRYVTVHVCVGVCAVKVFVSL